MRRRVILVCAIPVLSLLAACGSNSAKTQTLGSVTFNDHGTASVQGKSSVEIEADNYYFSPTFIRGAPGQTVQVQLTNDSGTKHNFSLSQQNVDTDLDPKQKAQVMVTIPASGVLQFFCEYHTSRGMNGELLSGSTAPQAPPAASPKPASSNQTPDYGY